VLWHILQHLVLLHMLKCLFVVATIVLFIVVAPVEVVVIRVFAIFVTAISVGFDIVAGVTNGEMAVENASCSGSYCT
jgi:hypothetical protein